MRWLTVVALFGGLAACYSPSIAPCRLACAGNACPDGLACNSQGRCAESPTAMCGPVTDGGDDAGDGGGVCDWPMISNVNPCALGAPESMAAVNIAAAGAPATINTDTLAIGGIQGLTLMVVTQAGTPPSQVTVAVVKTLMLQAGAGLNVTGTRPLIIVAQESVTLNGPINFVPSVVDAMCPTRGLAGGTVTTLAGGGGGGGGGYGLNSTSTAARPGGSGGNFTGGPATGGAAGDGGQAASGATVDALRPLRGGCPGGKGGNAGTTSVAGGNGGSGGGSLQISARVLIRLASTINVPGGAGAGGSPSTSTARSGAGGGGAGGAILLEAPMLDLQNNSLCANGGSGGGAGTTTSSAGVGQNGTCTNTAAPGGLGVNANDGQGGNGATGGTAATLGANGAPGSTAGHGGGGGGGSVGRIRLNGTITGAAATVTPQYTTGTL